MSSFFGWFYLTVQFGVVIARFVTPLLLNYSNLIALITYAVIVLLSLIIFVIGKLFYEIKPSPKENILFQFFSILFRSIPNCCERGNPHWIRDKTGKYDQSIVEDTKEVVNLLKLFLPLPIFWALYFQIFTTLVSRIQNTHQFNSKIFFEQKKKIISIFKPKKWKFLLI